MSDSKNKMKGEEQTQGSIQRLLEGEILTKGESVTLALTRLWRAGILNEEVICKMDEIHELREFGSKLLRLGCGLRHRNPRLTAALRLLRSAEEGKTFDFNQPPFSVLGTKPPSWDALFDQFRSAVLALDLDFFRDLVASVELMKRREEDGKLAEHEAAAWALLACEFLTMKTGIRPTKGEVKKEAVRLLETHTNNVAPAIKWTRVWPLIGIELAEGKSGPK